MHDLRDIEDFVRVVNAGSFTAAAEELGVSKSNISRRVAALEEWLGVRLMNRTTHRLELTEEGSAFYEWCRSGIDTLDDALRRFASAGRVHEHHVHVLRGSAPPTCHAPDIAQQRDMRKMKRLLLHLIECDSGDREHVAALQRDAKKILGVKTGDAGKSPPTKHGHTVQKRDR